MGPRIRNGKCIIKHVAAFALFVCVGFAQTGAFNGRCQATSSPNQVRSEGITEPVGDIVLFCSGGSPGSVVSGNLTIFLPVRITNRVDSANLTRDAAISFDLGSGFVPGAIAGQIAGNSISFNGISVTVPAAGNFGLRISGIRANASQLGRTSPAPIAASLAGT